MSRRPARDPRPLVLIPHRPDGNLYVGQLGQAYERAGWRVAYGHENLMQADIGPDLVHLQWPEEFYRWRGEGTPAARAERLRWVIERLQARGTPMAMTVHNLAPHEFFDDPLDRGVYQFLLERMQLLHHHCPLSQRALAAQYHLPASQRQLVVPHGHYLAYPHSRSGGERERARQRLGLRDDDFVFLHFGQMRMYKGLDLLQQAFAQTQVPSKHLLLAGRYRQPPGWAGRFERLGLQLRNRWRSDFSFHGRDIPDAEVHDFLVAADCMLLGHSAGLNSGVAVLGMSFGLRVIGPRIGCIEWVLSQGENLIYPAGDGAAMRHAMEAVARAGGGPSARNAEVAASWRWDDIALGVVRALEEASA